MEILKLSEKEIDKSLCLKCKRKLGVYCIVKNMWIPHTKICDKYWPKV